MLPAFQLSSFQVPGSSFPAFQLSSFQVPAFSFRLLSFQLPAGAGTRPGARTEAGNGDGTGKAAKSCDASFSWLPKSHLHSVTFVSIVLLLAKKLVKINFNTKST
jgi:hypothetical protein